MAIRFKLRQGELEAVETDTAAEAAEFYSLITQAPSTKRNGSRPRKSPSIKELSPKAKKMLDKILSHPEGISSPQLAKALDVEPKALGPLLGFIRQWAEETFGLGKDGILTKERRMDDRS